ncbi:UNVERIFIED_CONTAM: hypothetical protein Sradi_5272700 [Sesamum radiatum]|uniref:DUF4283 domain-containing protein n=1 Tax=Sesamum radiatum TaxID=300843 RepID=A0AAW2LNZ6_SESRA
MAPFVLNSADFPPLTRSNSPESTQQRSSLSTPEQTSQKSISEAAVPPEFEKFFLAESNPPSIGTVNTINGRPTITFSDSETQALTVDFRFALVGKFSHGSPPYSQLHRLLVKSGIKGAFTVSMINYKHALICLSTESDYNRLWLRRIWYLNGLPMRVFKWSPTFTTAHESPIAPIWVSFPELPAHLFKKDVLFTIAKLIGTPLQIADSTYNKSSLAKARVCIEIDLLKPVLKEVDLQIFGETIVQKIEYDQVPQYCSLCKHVGHKDSDCYSKGDAPKPPSRQRGKNEARTIVREKGECSKDSETHHRYASTVVTQNDESGVKEKDNQVDVVNANEVHAENTVSIAENESINGAVVGNVEHAMIEHDFVDNEVNIEHAFIENETIVEPSPNDVCAYGALIVRLDNFLCDLKKGTSWFRIDNALMLFDNFKQFGKVMKGIEEDVYNVIKRNRLALRSAMLYQKCVLIFDRVSQLNLKPCDVRSPPIATRTRRRKKGMNSLEPPDIHYF